MKLVVYPATRSNLNSQENLRAPSTEENLVAAIWESWKYINKEWFANVVKSINKSPWKGNHD